MDATLGAAVAGPLAGGANEPLATVQAASPGATLDSNAASFAASLERAAGLDAEMTPVARAMFEPLGRIDAEARELGAYAEQALASGDELTPSEIVMLTARSQEFMFHAQLTANVANRTADGLQQLFRQQS